MPPILQLKDIALTFGGTPLLEGVEVNVEPGARICLVGRNGSGKSTLLKIAAGLIEPDRGSVFVQPGTTICYLPQSPDFGGHTSVHDYVMAGLGPASDHHGAQRLIDELGLDGVQDPATLSGGGARRAAIARALAPMPDVLLLDEPTNHLDLPMIEWLERELSQRNCALVLISHDRRFLSTLSRATIWLDRGITRRIERGFSEFENWRDQVLEEEEAAQHKLGRRIVAEEHWLRHGVSARRKRNVKRLARLHDLRAQKRTHRKYAGQANVVLSEEDKSGTLVIEAKGISKSFGERAIVKDFSIRIHRGDRIGVIGANGSGKTTLLNMLTGALAPDSGQVRLGSNIAMVMLEQNRDSLSPETTLADALTEGRGDQVMVGDKPKHVASYMKDFLFSGEQMRTPLSALSGGELGRVMLARAFAKKSNVLVLDEPTNDLDIEMLDVLEELIAQYEGTVLLISHDRDFLDRCVDETIAPDGDGTWLSYAGGYSDVIAQRSGNSIFAPPAREAERTQRKERASTPAPDASAKKKRLSFNQKHALETLPKIIADLQKAILSHQNALEDATLFARDPDKFQRVSMELAQLQQHLARAEDQWLELEILREDIEGDA